MRAFVFLSAALLFSSCVSIKHNKKTLQPNSNNNLVTLSNKGTICLAKNKNLLTIKYYPLSTNCASSSLYSWKLNGFDINKKGSNINLESYSLYSKNKTKVHTQDCAGANIVTKKVILDANRTIYWGNKKIANTNNLDQISCFKSYGNFISKTKTIK